MARKKKADNKSEVRFSDVLSNTLGGRVSEITDEKLKKQGIGIKWEYDENKRAINIFVKCLKTDEEDDGPDAVWLEFQTHKGDRGWMNGDADYIVFENPFDWLIVNRKKLKQAVEEAIYDKTTTRDRATWFRFYQRPGGQSKAVKVPTSFVRKNADRIIIKREFLNHMKENN